MAWAVADAGVVPVVVVLQRECGVATHTSTRLLAAFERLALPRSELSPITRTAMHSDAIAASSGGDIGVNGMMELPFIELLSNSSATLQGHAGQSGASAFMCVCVLCVASHSKMNSFAMLGRPSAALCGSAVVGLRVHVRSL